MACLVDTCILLRAFERDAPEHAAIIQAIRSLWQAGDDLVVTVQNIAEFWNVSTRPPGKNGLDLPLERVKRRIRVIERFATVLAESPASYSAWKRLVFDFGVQGVKVHDARLVSVMLAHQIPSILTLNVEDFFRYSEIRAVAPRDLASA